ncbi:MAG: hypothetical protein A2Y17_02335 [Clostridiales bacterium GWF2_38_85]|nr:MAG: hypothetical protein A2Y17_02335 [Clostridiales bacterium GWF2_38_85]HBL85036.1 hypothetical protein [Clostridiales bacterium]
MESKRTERHTAEEKTKLIAAYLQSGLSQKSARNKGTLRNWLKADKTQSEQQEPQGWTKVSVTPLVREQLIKLQAGKFSLEINQNTYRKLLSELLSVLVTRFFSSFRPVYQLAILS